MLNTIRMSLIICFLWLHRSIGWLTKKFFFICCQTSWKVWYRSSSYSLGCRKCKMLFSFTMKKTVIIFYFYKTTKCQYRWFICFWYTVKFCKEERLFKLILNLRWLRFPDFRLFFFSKHFFHLSIRTTWCLKRIFVSKKIQFQLSMCYWRCFVLFPVDWT